ncbi:hypothetical protein [Lacinutrix salivirga]
MKSLLILLCFFVTTTYVWSQNTETVQKYYDNGQLKYEGQKIDNVRSGDWKSYYETGELESEYSYTEGKKNDNTIFYFKNGEVKSITKKIDDLVFYKEYYESGKLFVDRIIGIGAYKEYLEDNTLKVSAEYNGLDIIGIWNSYYDTGELQWQVQYVDGYKDGFYKEFFKSGTLKTEGTYKENFKNGKEKRYNEQGVLTWEGGYKNDELDGKWKQFNTEEKTLGTVKYDEGTLIKSDEDLEVKPTTVPDGLIEKVPMHPECKTALGNNAVKKCLNDVLKTFIIKSFNTDLAGSFGLSGKNRINIWFKISKTGDIIDVKTKAPHVALSREAERLLTLLPIMEPGQQRGEKVDVQFYLPITFMVQ